jgi:hypothetical protein
MNIKKTLPGAQTTSFGPLVVCWQHFGVLSDVEDVGVVACVDERWWKEAEGSVVERWWWLMLMWHAFGRHGNGEPNGTTFSFGCANMTKWSVPSFRVYKPLLSVFLFLGHTPL